MTDQKTLFETDWGTVEHDPQQAPHEDLKRVTGKIADVIREFRATVGSRVWTMSELHAFAGAREEIAPESAGRVFRSLKTELPYKLVSRSCSQYQFIGLADGTTEASTHV